MLFVNCFGSLLYFAFKSFSFLFDSCFVFFFVCFCFLLFFFCFSFMDLTWLSLLFFVFFFFFDSRQVLISHFYLSLFAVKAHYNGPKLTDLVFIISHFHNVVYIKPNLPMTLNCMYRFSWKCNIAFPSTTKYILSFRKFL
jgi:hypothetical protein